MHPVIADTRAKAIVERILNDLVDRSGFQNIWEECDEDIQNEIRCEWIKIITDVLMKEVTVEFGLEK